MPEQIPSILTILQIASVFGIVLSIWLVAVMLWHMRRSSREEKVTRRLEGNQASPLENPRVLRLWHEGKVRTTTVAGEKKPSFSERFEELRRVLGWEMPMSTFISAIVGLACLGFVSAYAFTGNMVIAVITTVGVLQAIRTVASGRANKEAALFETQLADALGLAARSLRAGHPVLTAFQLIVDETEAPVRDTFGDIVQQQSLGKSLEESIVTTAARCPSPDMKLFAAAMVIQLRSGGNLADMMDRLIVVIRDRIRMARRVRVLTSQTQLSKRILIAVPIFLFFFMYLKDPEYIDPLITTDAGKVLLVISGSCLLVGSWIMNKIADLKY